MRRILIAILATLTTAMGFAQNTAVVKGTVNTNVSKPAGGATVALLEAKDSSLYKAAISENDGNYLFEKIKTGNYLVKITSVNFNDWYSQKFELKEGASYTVPAATLTTADKKLKDVVVSTTKKPMIEVKADRTVFNVESSINATGSNALQLLQKSPGITVDKDENISMKGKNGVKIYLDGKPSPMAGTDLAAYLKSVQSSDIESIEMIENPSAKYDASGNAGIINIKFKKNKKYGTNGSTSLGYGQGMRANYNGNLSLNYRNKKVNLFSNVSAEQGTWQNYNDFYRLQSDSIYDQKNINISRNKSANVKAGADYFLNSKNTIGFMYNGNYSDNRWTADGNTIISPQINKIPLQVLNAQNSIPSKRDNNNININYRFVDTSGHELNIDADRGWFANRGSSYQPNYYLDYNTGAVLRQRFFANNTPVNIDIKTAKADYEQNLLKGKFGVGVKYASVKTDNTFNFYNIINGEKQQDWERSNRFTYTENVAAGYINYNRAFKKWSYQMGLRAEQTNSEGILRAKSSQTMNDTTETVKRSYLDFFPSGAISYTLSEKHQFNLNYSRRIDRPNYQDLNPFENKLDELTYEKGNAFLKPQYTNSFSMSHTYKSFLTTSLAYSHISDYITPINDTARINATFITNKNLATQDIYSINIGAPITVNKRYNIYANANLSQSRFRADFGSGKIIHLNVTTLNYYNQHTVTLGKGYTAEVSGWFNTPSIWGGTFKTEFMWSADAGLQKTLFNNNATLKLSVSDVFKTNHWSAESNFSGVKFNGKGGWDSRRVQLTFQYRFGSSTVSAARQRQSGLDSESKRIK